ncbi:MAG: error-prone DNA polymerase [Acidobacteria bacterium]|nr:MAG: error-prone DNA polymerase [Acidobacteriota bacterium]
MSYIELHARSAFSFLEGASLPESLITTCAHLDMPAMALLDSDGVYGVPRFHLAAKKARLKAYIGAEVTCKILDNVILSDFETRLRDEDESKDPYSQNNVTGIGIPGCARNDNPFRLPLLVASRTGYQNLCRLITKMKLRAKKGEGAVQKEELKDHAHGLVCLTGGAEGPLATALRQGGMEKALGQVEHLVGIFGQQNVYIELQRHFQREEETRNRAAIQIARMLRLPLLASNGVSYATAKERDLCDALTAIRHHRTLATAGRLLSRNSERYLKSPQEMQQLFSDLPGAIANTVELSARLEFTLKDLGYEFPRYTVPEGETMNSFLRDRTWQGFQQRYGRAATETQHRARRQIERELKLIEKLDLAGYFLIVWDLVHFCHEQNILVQGRGSAANSAVCYSLGITAVDPVGMDLLFERFLSEERGEWPDIDLDLPSGDEREKVIQYLYRRYGERGAAMTANVITYRNRMAAREMGKTLGFDPETLHKISAAVATWEFRDQNDALDRRFRDAGLDLRHPRLRKYYELCIAVQDLPRHLGQHSGGMVICQGQLDSVVPLEPASMPGRVVVQWDKEDCADMGIVKVDLLGLGMMAVLKDSLELISHHYHDQVDLAHLPQDDPAVYSALQQADTVGMFQVESRAQMSCLPRLRPKRFYDIVVQVAIIRPGPIVGEMVNPFLQRRQGREAVTYPHPSLEPVLKRTLGVPLFQEQLLRMAMVVAGFSGGEAEELRRAMGFKRSEARMREIEAKLRTGMTRNGIPPLSQEQIILSITSFALYGFPESHAASFALIAYASAYLKCHYLAAFTAALLNHQPMGFYSPAALVKDAQRHGLKMLPVDVTRSEWMCTLEAVIHPPSAASPIALRLGLRYVRGLREEAAQALRQARTRASFTSIHDLTRRVPELRKDELSTLAEIGALNRIGGSPPRQHKQFPIDSASHHSESKIGNGKLEVGNFTSLHRRDALWQVERAVRGSGPLLENLPEPDSPSPLEPMNNEERLVADFHGTGLTVGPHPVAYRRAWLDAQGVRRASDLRTIPSGKRLRIGGCVITRQRPGTAKGFVFVSLEDETGVANAIIAPDLFHQNRLLLASERFLAIEGILQNQDNVISVKAERVFPLFITRAETTSHDFH